jgi:hypothetical protein
MIEFTVAKRQSHLWFSFALLGRIQDSSASPSSFPSQASPQGIFTN